MKSNVQLESNIVHFFSKKNEYRSLSNFWETDVVIDNIRIYETGEHCFHGEKYKKISELYKDNEARKASLINYSKGFLKPSKYKTSTEAKKAGGKNGFALNGAELILWNKISIDIQMQICKWKFINYKEVRIDLAKSNNKILIHPAMRCREEKMEERLWEGRAILVDNKIIVLGKNLLGKIWMELRSQLINDLTVEDIL
jgi:predicted NAD-dependent protein-ADP-ribosyltransferase YbiA (DUF1768 family)